MVDLNFEPYFKNTDIQYYDSKYIITILENILGKKLDYIKKEIKNNTIFRKKIWRRKSRTKEKNRNPKNEKK